MDYKYTGTGNTGAFAWIMQRISGVVLAMCGTIIFFQMAFVGMHGLSSWLLFPVLAFGMWHTFSGFKMITDDYVRCRCLRLILLILYWGVGITVFGVGLAGFIMSV